MALNTSKYTDPGAYIGEVLVPGAINIAGQAFVTCLIGTGNRSKNVSNEAAVRGFVGSESIIWYTTAVSGYHLSSVFANRGDRKTANTVVYKDGTAIADTLLRYPPAYITGTALLGGTFTLDVNERSLVIGFDGKVPLTVKTAVQGTAGNTTISATSTYVVSDTGAANVTVFTKALIVAAINSAFEDHPSYGASYAGVASISGNYIKLTSPTSGATSDVVIFNAIGGTGATELFGGAPTAAAPLRPGTQVEIAASQYSASSTYTVDYVSDALSPDADGLVQTTGVTAISQVGDFAGTDTYGTDAEGYTLASSKVSWAGAAWTTASITGSTITVGDALAEGASDVLKIAIDNKAALEIDLVGTMTQDGWTTAPGSTATDIATNINIKLADSLVYGPAYQAVASAVGSVIVLTSPTKGRNGALQLFAPAANDATGSLFSNVVVASSYTQGTGKAPGVGSTYFVSYTHDRPSTDYASSTAGRLTRHFSLDSAFDEVGGHGAATSAPSNPLAMAIEIAFANGAESVVIAQIDDSTTAGTPSMPEIQEALDVVGESGIPTEICLVGAAGTLLAAQVALKDHIENNSGPFNKQYRRAWMGLGRDAQIGDKETADTIIYTAAKTLQVSANSAARGRLIVMAPPQVGVLTKTVRLTDGTIINDVALDSTYLAVAAAARQTSFDSPSDTLARQTLAGFDIDTITRPISTVERAQMASAGVTVVTYDAGNLRLLDPITTERAGGAMISFEQIQASLQKDNVTRKMTQGLDANLVAIVPTDLSSFVLDIKSVIGSIISGEISAGSVGPYLTDSGLPRPVSYVDDMEVTQDPNDPTKFNFKYFYNLRYPALRLFGEYSVDNPFFG
jgi:hypothetical protein